VKELAQIINIVASYSSEARVGTCPLTRPGWFVRFAQIRLFLEEWGWGVADSAWAWRFTVYLLWTHHENVLSTADCICISGF